MGKAQKNHFRDSHFLKKVGQRIDKLLKEKKITHEVFYNDTAINPHRLIVGKVNMTLSTFKRICDYLDISPHDFFKKT